MKALERYFRDEVGPYNERVFDESVKRLGIDKETIMAPTKPTTTPTMPSQPLPSQPTQTPTYPTPQPQPTSQPTEPEPRP